MRLWISATATVVLIAIVTFSQFQRSNQPEALATVSNEPEASATDTEPDTIVEVVNVEAELSQSTPLPPKALPFVRFDEPPYATFIPATTDPNIVQVEFNEPEPNASQEQNANRRWRAIGFD